METSRHDRAPRVATNHRAVMRDRGGAIIKAYITNLSRSGFRASTNAPLAVGDGVTICTDESDEYPAVSVGPMAPKPAENFSTAPIFPMISGGCRTRQARINHGGLVCPAFPSLVS
jgi:hypothetical protein